MPEMPGMARILKSKTKNKTNHQGRSCSSNLVTTYYVAMSNMERKDILLLPLFYSC